MSKLAINGGEPTRREPFPSWPVWDEREEKQLFEVLRSGIWGSFNQADSKVQQFENEFACSHSARYGRCVTNGSAALEVALRAVGIEYGDEVIVPPYTFLATASACLVVGAIPRFADINPETYNIDPAEIEKAITAKTRAIIPVHIGGCPADMDSILAIAERHSLWVIEDACQAHAASWDGRRVGSMGDLGCFSFQSSKNINAGEGGIILTSDEQLAERCWSIRSYGRIQGRGWYQHEILGDNYRMTEWQAAILLAQLTRLEELAQRREENALYLSEGLDQIEGVKPQRRDPKVTEHAYHLFILRYEAEAFGGLPREVFLSALRAEGIPCAAGYTPLYQASAIQKEVTRLQRLVTGEENDYSLPDCPVTERACNEEAVWLTQNMFLGTKKDMDDIVDAIAKIKENVDTCLR